MTKQIKVSAMEIASQHWPQPMPEWVRLLAQSCDKDTQAKAATRIRRSASLVNQVLKNTYKGNLDAVKTRVETAFKVDSVRCPILGQITGSECMANQEAPYNPSNHVAVALFRQCRRCPQACRRKQ